MGEGGMKWVLLAVAGYLVYNYMQQQTATATQPSGAAPPPGKAPPVNAELPRSTEPPAYGAPTEGRPNDRVLMRAATNANWARDAGDYKMGIDHWNWYRTQYQIQVVGDSNPPADIFQPALDDVVAPERRWAGHTAEEYHELLRAKGLSGLGWNARIPYSGSWNTRWTM